MLYCRHQARRAPFVAGAEHPLCSVNNTSGVADAAASEEDMMDKAKTGASGAEASKQIDARIAELSDWRGAMLARLRKLIHEADPEVVEEVKWGGTPVWSHAGIITTGETYKAVVKLTFAKGAQVDDPKSLFNSSLEGNVRRAIDFREGEAVDEEALRALIRAAVAVNVASQAAKKRKS